jgi:two-component system LytT family sensor kinase
MAASEFFAGSDAAARLAEETRKWGIDVAAPARAAVDRRTIQQVLLMSAVYWAAMFVMHTSQMLMMNMNEGPATLATRVGLTALCYVLCMPIGWIINRSFHASIWRRVALIGFACFCAAIVYGSMQYMVWNVWFAISDDLSKSGVWIAALRRSDYNTILFLLWSTFCMAIFYAAHLRERESSLLEARALAQQAELKMLRYQINPHFLFNTLNAVSALIVTGQSQAADEMIAKLARFFRNALSRESTAKVTLSEELRVQLEYLDIELTRFPERVRLNTTVPADLAKALVPHLILQPLFENAIKHGVARSPARVEIRTSVHRENGTLVISIDNDTNPSGSSEEQAGEGVGLANVAQRLASLYGADAGMSTNAHDGRFIVELRLPLELTL